MKTILSIITIVTYSFFVSCSDNHFSADTSDIALEININKFDKEIRSYDIKQADKFIAENKEKYKEFFEIYNTQILQLNVNDSLYYKENFYNFVLYNEAEGIFDNIDVTFGDYSQLNSQLTDLFKHYKYHFPKKKIPSIITFLSGFNLSVVTTENFIGIGTDRYLGADSKYYQGLDKYIKSRMDKAYIPVDIAGAIAESDYLFDPQGSHMLQHMIYKGKIQYFINSLLPEYSDTLRFMYTKKQLSWARKNEANIWNHLAEDKLLFSNDRMQIKQYTDNAPFTIPLSDSSAPRAAVFVGYKIVLQYMKNNPEITLKTLMEEEDAQKILSGANYHP